MYAYEYKLKNIIFYVCVLFRKNRILLLTVHSMYFENERFGAKKKKTGKNLSVLIRLSFFAYFSNTLQH